MRHVSSWCCREPSSGQLNHNRNPRLIGQSACVFNGVILELCSRRHFSALWSQRCENMASLNTTACSQPFVISSQIVNRTFNTGRWHMRWWQAGEVRKHRRCDYKWHACSLMFSLLRSPIACLTQVNGAHGAIIHCTLSRKTGSHLGQVNYSENMTGGIKCVRLWEVHV